MNDEYRNPNPTMMKEVFMFDESPEDEICDIPKVSDIPSDCTTEKSNFDVLNDSIYSLVDRIFTHTNTDKKLVELFINPTTKDGVEYGDVIITHMIRNNRKDKKQIQKRSEEASCDNDNEYIIDLGLAEYEDESNSRIGECYYNVNKRHEFSIAAKDGSFDFDFDLFYVELVLFNDQLIFSNIDKSEHGIDTESMTVRAGHKLLPIDIFYYETYGSEDYESSIAWLTKTVKNIENHEIYCKLDDTYISEFDFEKRARNIPLIGNRWTDFV